MKKFKLVLICLLSMMLVAFPLSACSGDEPGGGEQPVQYTVTYGSSDSEHGTVSCKTQGGTALDSGDKVDDGTVIVFSASQNTGYSFEGFFSGTQKVCAEKEYTLTVSSDVDVKAEFKVQSFSLSYSATSGGGVTCQIESGSAVEYKTSITLTATPLTGYGFVGWYIGTERVSTESEYTFDMPAQNVELQAKFDLAQYALTYSVNDTAMGEISCSIESGTNVAYGTSITLTANEFVGYDFVGWYTGTEEKSTESEYTFDMGENAVDLTAKFEIAKRMLTYSVNDTAMGEISCSITSGTNVAYGTSITLTASEFVGYDFVGWYTGTERVSTESEYTFDMGESAVELTAKFQAEIRTVSYFDGYDRLKLVEVEYNTTVSDFRPTKSTGLFVGWYTDASCTVPFNASTAITQNTVLYSKWQPIVVMHEVRFVTDEGEVIVTQEIEDGAKIINIPASPQKDGYTFAGWEYLNENNQEYVKIDNIRDFTAHSNLTIRASFDIIKHDVKFYENDLKYTTCEVEHGSKVAKPQTPVWSNNTQKFVKWVYKDDETVDFDFETIINQPIEIKAVWAPVTKTTYTVKFFKEENAIDATEPIDTQIIEEGESATAPANPTKKGYTFDGWGTMFDEVTGNLDIYATYKINSYTVRFLDWNGKMLKEETVVFEQSATPPVDVPDREGYTSVGWSEDYTKIEDDVDIYVVYEINKFKLTFYRVDDENNEIEIGTQTDIEYGAYATVPETPTLTDYSFEGWYTDATFETKFKFSKEVKSDLSVYAKFVKDEKELFEVVFLDGGNKISEQKILSGNTAIVPADPTREGHNFIGWVMYDANKEEDVEVTDFTITANVTFYADYEKKEYEVKFLEADGEKLITIYRADGVTVIGNSIKVKYDECIDFSLISMPVPATVLNKVPNGWDKDAYTYKITENTNFIAQYVNDTCEITYVVDGTPTVVAVEKGGYANIPSTPTKIGYIFRYWYETDQTQAFDFSTRTIDAPITLNAYFEPIANICTVSFKDKDGNDYGKIQAVKKDGYAMEPAPYVDEQGNKYTWCLENENTGFDFENTKITQSIVLYAKLIG